MTDATLVLSKENQDKIVASAGEIQKTSHAKAVKSFGFAAAAGAVTAGLFAIAASPVIVMAGTVAGVITFLAGARALGNFVTERSMSGVKNDAGTEGFVDKMKNRVEKLTKLHKVTDFVAGLGLFGVVGGWAIAAVFPPAAPVVAATHTAALWTWIGGGAIRDAFKPARDSAAQLNNVVAEKAPKDSLEAILQPSEQYKAAAKAPAPAPAFAVAAQGVAANNNAEKPAQKSAFRRFLHM